jgi:hypothetical protein
MRTVACMICLVVAAAVIVSSAIGAWTTGAVSVSEAKEVWGAEEEWPRCDQTLGTYGCYIDTYMCFPMRTSAGEECVGDCNGGSAYCTGIEMRSFCTADVEGDLLNCTTKDLICGFHVNGNGTCDVTSTDPIACDCTSYVMTTDPCVLDTFDSSEDCWMWAWHVPAQPSDAWSHARQTLLAQVSR